METSKTEYEQNGERERTAANNFVVRFWNFCKKQKFRLVGEQTVAARNDVTAKKLLADCFKTFSGRPEDWTVSGPCHLYFNILPWHSNDVCIRTL